MATEHVVRFGKSHALELYCYDASDANIRYSSTFVGNNVNDEPGMPREIAPSKKPGDEERQKPHMSGYPVFADPVRLSWHDLRDNLIEYTFSFDDIFPDRLIPHPEELDDRIFWPEPLDGDPGIILEIIDRTLNIYTVINLHVRIPNTDTVKMVLYREKVFTREF
jgi:hypothetical protein